MSDKIIISHVVNYTFSKELVLADPIYNTTKLRLALDSSEFPYRVCSNFFSITAYTTLLSISAFESHVPLVACKARQASSAAAIVPLSMMGVRAIIYTSLST